MTRAPSSGWWSTTAVAKLTGYAQIWVMQLCRSGKINAKQPNGPGTTWLIHQDEVDRVLAQIEETRAIRNAKWPTVGGEAK